MLHTPHENASAKRKIHLEGPTYRVYVKLFVATTIWPRNGQSIGDQRKYLLTTFLRKSFLGVVSD